VIWAAGSLYFDLPHLNSCEPAPRFDGSLQPFSSLCSRAYAEKSILLVAFAGILAWSLSLRPRQKLARPFWRFVSNVERDGLRFSRVVRAWAYRSDLQWCKEDRRLHNGKGDPVTLLKHGEPASRKRDERAWEEVSCFLDRQATRFACLKSRMIRRTAIVAPNAQIDSDVEIGPCHSVNPDFRDSPRGSGILIPGN
jgi:hypothetical protein